MPTATSKLSRTDLLSAGFVALSFLVALALYARLPDRVATHWNGRGVADGFLPKPWGALILPLVMASVWLLLWLIPRVSPRGYGLERSHRAYAIVQAAIMAFLFVVTVMALLAATGAPVSIARVIPAAVGALFMVLGNFLPKFTRNFFVGVRTPWTLASDEVWLRTHRLAGALFVAAGLLIVSSSLIGAGMIAILPAVGAVALAPVIYSFVIYRRIEGTDRSARQP